MFKTLVKEGVEVLVLVLRDYFTTNTDITGHVPPFTWTADLNTSQIFIAGSFPNETRFMPSITVKQSGGAEQQMGLRKYAEMVTEGDASIKRFSGKWYTKFQITVAALSTADKDFILDQLVLALSVRKFDEIQYNGVIIEPNKMTVSPDETVMFDTTTPIYRNIVTVPAFLEWYEDVTMTESILKKVILHDTKEAGPFFEGLRSGGAAPISTQGGSA